MGVVLPGPNDLEDAGRVRRLVCLSGVVGACSQTSGARGSPANNLLSAESLLMLLLPCCVARGDADMETPRLCIFGRGVKLASIKGRGRATGSRCGEGGGENESSQIGNAGPAVGAELDVVADDCPFDCVGDGGGETAGDWA